MGSYVNMWVKTPIKNPEVLGYLFSGFAGEPVLFTEVNKSELEEKGSAFMNSTYGNYNIDVSRNEDGTITMYDFGAKYGSYQLIMDRPFCGMSVLKRLANYIGDCEVTLSAEEGCSLKPLSDESMLKYTTEHKENNFSINELNKQFTNYAPISMFVECVLDGKDDTNHRMNVALDELQKVETYIKTTFQKANLIALVYYSNKSLADITVEDIKTYTNKESHRRPFIGGYDISKKDRCNGLASLFKNIGRNDLAKAVYDIEQAIIKEVTKKENFLKVIANVRNIGPIFGEAKDSSWEDNNGNKCCTLYLPEAIDYYAQYRHYNGEEKLDFPFGQEVIRVNIFDNGNVSYSYVHKGFDAATNTKISCRTLKEVLSKVQDCSYLEFVLQGITNLECAKMTEQDIEELKSKIPTMKVVRDEAKKKHLEEFIILNVDKNNRSDVKLLGAKWAGGFWVCKKSERDKFANWIK